MELCATSGLEVKHKLCIYVVLLALKFVLSHIYCSDIAFLFLYYIFNMQYISIRDKSLYNSHLTNLYKPVLFFILFYLFL